MSLNAQVTFGAVLCVCVLAWSVPAWCLNTTAQNLIESTEIKVAPASTRPAALTLDEVLRRTLQHNPELAVFSQETRAREFEMLQAGLRANPELSVEVENVLGSGEYAAMDSAETTLRISQLFELGDKRSLRQDIARQDLALAEREYAVARAEALAVATERFIAVLAAEETLSLATEQVNLAQQVIQTVDERIAAGKTAAIERLQFQILQNEARLQQDKARLELKMAQQSLATSWGSENVDFETVQGNFEQVQSPPDWTELAGRLDQSPQMVLQKFTSNRAGAVLDLEQANSAPDLTFSLGIRNNQSNGDNSLVAAIAMPLPIFNRNQAGIAAARSRQLKAREQERAQHLQLREDLAAAWQKLIATCNEVSVLREEILPTTRQAFEAVTYGYESGKFGFLEVLDAQRTLFEAKSRYVDALTAYHKTVAELERLLGQSLHPANNNLESNDNERGQS